MRTFFLQLYLNGTAFGYKHDGCGIDSRLIGLLLSFPLSDYKTKPRVKFRHLTRYV